MKVWEKAKAFYKEHKVAIVAILSGIGGVAGGVLLYKLQHGTEQVSEVEQPQLPKADEDDWSWADPMLQTIVHYEKEAENGTNSWKECPFQRERWDKLVEFAKDIRPGDGEYFVLEGTNPDCNTDHVEWFVHHWQDHMPAYPPERLAEIKGGVTSSLLFRIQPSFATQEMITAATAYPLTRISNTPPNEILQKGMTSMKTLYLVASSELPNELPAEIIRGFTSEKKAAKLFKSITGESDDTIRRVINDEEWVTNHRLLDDECFYTIIQTEIEE